MHARPMEFHWGEMTNAIVRHTPAQCGKLIDKSEREPGLLGCQLKSGRLLTAKRNWKCDRKLQPDHVVPHVMFWLQKGRTHLWIKAWENTMMLREAGQSFNPCVPWSQTSAFRRPVKEAVSLKSHQENFPGQRCLPLPTTPSPWKNAAKRGRWWVRDSWRWLCKNWNWKEGGAWPELKQKVN